MPYGATDRARSRIEQANETFEAVDGVQPPNTSRQAVAAERIMKDKANEAHLAGDVGFKEGFAHGWGEYSLFSAGRDALQSWDNRDPSWEPDKNVQVQDLNDLGLMADERSRLYLMSATSQEDYDTRRLRLAGLKDYYDRAAATQGWGTFSDFMGNLTGAMADPGAFALSAGTVSLGRAGLAVKRLNDLSRRQQVGLLTAEGAVANVAIDSILQQSKYGKLYWSDLAVSGVMGAAFSAGISTPLVVREARAGRLTGEFDRLSNELTEAVDSGAEQAVIDRLTQNLSDVRGRLISDLKKDSDEVAVTAWELAAQGVTSEDVSRVIQEARKIRDENVTTSAGAGNRYDLFEDRKVPPTNPRAPGINLSSDSANITDFAYNQWSEPVYPELEAMQSRIRDWYEFREERLKGYAGLDKWLDTPGLTLARSNSRVARMLGSLLFENATGIGGHRYDTASINYEKLINDYRHSYMPALKKSLSDSMQGSDRMWHYVGGGVDAENAWGRAVANERLRRRQAVARGEEYHSEAPQHVQDAANAMDHFIYRMASDMRAEGLDQGDSILAARGHIGFMPYNWSWRKLSHTVSHSPEVFESLTRNLQRQFHEKAIARAFDDMEGLRTEWLQRQQARLEADVYRAIEDLDAAVQAGVKGKKLQGFRGQEARTQKALDNFLGDQEAAWRQQMDQIKANLQTDARNQASTYLSRVMQDPESRARTNVNFIAEMAEDLLLQENLGQRVDPFLTERFADRIRDRANDRSRTELDLLRDDGDGVVLLDFIDHNPMAQLQSLSHQMAGRVALARSGGFRNDFQIDAALDAARVDGATPHELEQLKFGLDFFSNRLNPARMEDNAAMHTLRNFTFAARMGKLGISQMADIPQVVSTLGFSNMMVALGSFGRQLVDGSLIFTKDGNLNELGKQLTQDLPGTMGREHRLMNMIPEDAATGAAQDVGSGAMLYAQRFSARAAQFTGYVGLANAVNMALHRAVTPMLVEEMLTAIRKGESSISTARMADAGIPPEVATRIKKMLDKYDTGRKRGGRINWDQWEDQVAADLFTSAIHRATYQTLQKAMIGEQQTWLATSPIGRLIGQFRRFGLTAAEKISMRNIGHQDANAYLMFTLGAAWASMLYVARVHMNAQGKENREEYIEEQLSGPRMARGVMMLWNASGILPDGMALGDVIFGSTPMHGADPAAALGMIRDVAGAGRGVGDIVRGEADGSTAARAVRIMPGGNSIFGTWLQNELNAM